MLKPVQRWRLNGEWSANAPARFHGKFLYRFCTGSLLLRPTPTPFKRAQRFRKYLIPYAGQIRGTQFDEAPFEMIRYYAQRLADKNATAVVAQRIPPAAWIRV